MSVRRSSGPLTGSPYDRSAVRTTWPTASVSRRKPSCPNSDSDHVHGAVTRQQSSDLLLLVERVEPVARDARDRDARANGAECRGDATAGATDVVVVHRLTQHDVRVRVESSVQLLALVLQVGLHGVATAVQRCRVVLVFARESDVELVLGAVAHLSESSRDGQADRGEPAE